MAKQHITTLGRVRAEIAEALERLEAAGARVETARRRIGEIRSRVDPTLAGVRQGPGITRAEYWQLLAERPAVEAELAQAEIEVEQVTATVRALREREIAALGEQLRVEAGPLCQELQAGLAELVPVAQRLAALGQAHHEATRCFVDPLAFMPLVDEPGVRESLFNVWQRSVRDRGFLA